MPNLKEIKNRITSIQSTHQITKAMKMVSASKLKKAHNKIITMRSFTEKFHDIFCNLIQSVDENTSHEGIFPKNKSTKQLWVVITSDRGLCGGFNSSVCKNTIQKMKEENLHPHQVVLLPIGKKGKDFLSKKEYTIESHYVDAFENLNYKKSIEIASYLKKEYENGKYNKIQIIYNNFKNTALQVVTRETFLPLPISMEKEKGENSDFIIEPDNINALKFMSTQFLYQKIYETLLNSSTAEHAARMITMEKATENATEILKELKLTYNRTRQAVITREIIEIVSGAIALENN